MTDAEIIKALECCSQHKCDCECPKYYDTTDVDICRTHLIRSSLDFINRLQADKEALIAGQETLQKALAEKNAEIEELKTVFDYDFSKFESEYDSKIKAEAIKEYKNKVENDIVSLLGKSNCTDFLESLDYRYKEMVGEQDV